MAFTDQSERYGAGFVAALAGYGASRLLGVMFWLPAVFSAVAFFALGRWWTQASTALHWGCALLLGQCAWMALGAILVPAQLSAVLVDIVLGLALAGWMIARPTRAPVILLIILQAFGLVLNALTLAAVAGQGGTMVVALSMHVLIRLGIILAAGIALKVGLTRPVDDDELEEVFS